MLASYVDMLTLIFNGVFIRISITYAPTPDIPLDKVYPTNLRPAKMKEY